MSKRSLPLRYGAAELKESANRNLGAAVTISIVLHVAAIGLYLALARPAEALRDRGAVRHLDTILVEYGGKQGAKTAERSRGTTPAHARRSNGGPIQKFASRVAAPLVVDDSTTTDPNAFATTSEAPASGRPDGDSTGTGDGDGSSDGTNANDGGGDATDGVGAPAGEPLDLSVEFHSDVEMPAVDMAAITSGLEYPPLALEHGIEGTVDVRVLIGLDGRAERVEVAASTNRLFDGAALAAVRRARFGAARQNSVPVRVWMAIPIRFRLD